MLTGRWRCALVARWIVLLLTSLVLNNFLRTLSLLGVTDDWGKNEERPLRMETGGTEERPLGLETGGRLVVECPLGVETGER